MLTQDDVNWIKSNRSELVQNRTESITILKPQIGGTDPYTNEPIELAPLPIVVQAVWKEYSTVSNGDRSVVGGVELRQDDVKVTFDSSVDLVGVKIVQRDSIDFELIATDEKGIGETNRFECVARRVV